MQNWIKGRSNNRFGGGAYYFLRLFTALTTDKIMRKTQTASELNAHKKKHIALYASAKGHNQSILQGEDGHQSVYEVDVAQHFYAEISVLFGL